MLAQDFDNVLFHSQQDDNGDVKNNCKIKLTSGTILSTSEQNERKMLHLFHWR